MITYPLNNIFYSAEDAELFHCTRTSGVFSADDEFAASVTGADNTVTIGPGIAWIRNTRFSGKVAANKTPVSLDMGLADGSYPRIDAVVIQFDANANQTAIVVKQGVAASSPVPPEVVQTEAVYELHIYHVRRAAGAAVVSASDITDIRQDRNYCGVMMDDVTNIDENKFLSKTAYDPSGAVEEAGGIAKYVGTNSIPLSQKGAKEGVATLGSDGKVPVTQLPTMDYIPTSQKGAASGVATLDSSGKVPASQLQDYIVGEKGTGTVTVVTGNVTMNRAYVTYKEILGFVHVHISCGIKATDGIQRVRLSLSGLPVMKSVANASQYMLGMFTISNTTGYVTSDINTTSMIIDLVPFSGTIPSSSTGYALSTNVDFTYYTGE